MAAGQVAADCGEGSQKEPRAIRGNRHQIGAKRQGGQKPDLLPRGSHGIHAAHNATQPTPTKVGDRNPANTDQ